MSNEEPRCSNCVYLEGYNNLCNIQLPQWVARDDERIVHRPDHECCSLWKGPTDEMVP